MCAWSAAAAAAFKIGSSLYNQFSSSHSAKQAAAANYAYNIASMNHQYNLTRSLNKNAYQDTTYSMRQAGINPMLAITNGVNNLSAGSGSNGTQNPTISQMDGDAISSAVQLKNEKQRVKNETNIANSTIKKQDYESDLAHEQSALINEQNRQLQEYGPLERQQNLINSAKQAALLDAQKADVQNQMLNRSLLTNSQVGALNAQASSAKQTAIQQQRDNEWFEKHPFWYSFGQGASAVGNVFRGGLSKAIK